MADTEKRIRIWGERTPEQEERRKAYQRAYNEANRERIRIHDRNKSLAKRGLPGIQPLPPARRPEGWGESDA